MTKVTSQNNGSPQISRALRDREEQAEMEGGQQSETGACALPCDRVKTVQDLIGLYEKAAETTAPCQSSCFWRLVLGERPPLGRAGGAVGLLPPRGFPASPLPPPQVQLGLFVAQVVTGVPLFFCMGPRLANAVCLCANNPTSCACNTKLY